MWPDGFKPATPVFTAEFLLKKAKWEKVSTEWLTDIADLPPREVWQRAVSPKAHWQIIIMEAEGYLVFQSLLKDGATLANTCHAEVTFKGDERAWPFARKLCKLLREKVLNVSVSSLCGVPANQIDVG